MNARRLFVCLAALPLAFYAYACSSDSTDTPAEDGGTPDTDSGTNPGTDSGTNPGTDSGNPGTDSGTDGGADAGPLCVGNPFLASPDAGTPDGGAVLDAGVSKQIVTANANAFLEGPQWVETAAGSFLVYSEFDPTERILRVGADGGGPATLRGGAALPNNVGPIGNAIRNGVIVTAAAAKNGGGTPIFLVTQPDGGIGTSITAPADTDPNDLAVGKDGRIYWTDPQYQTQGNVAGMYATATDAGAPNRFVTYNPNATGERPNGIALSPDGTKLYVALTEPGRIDVYTVQANGTVTTPGATLIGTAKLGARPEGLAVDVVGNIYVAEADVDLGTDTGFVEAFKPDGTKLGSIPFTANRPTGVAFGGPDNKTLFVTAKGGVFTYANRCAGVR